MNTELNLTSIEKSPRDSGASSSALFGIWIDVEKEKPKTGKKVLVTGKNEGAKTGYRAIACFYPAGTLDADMWDDPPEEWWNEDETECRNPVDGWWEWPVEIEQVGILNNVTHWMPLPDMPNAELR